MSGAGIVVARSRKARSLATRPRRKAMRAAGLPAQASTGRSYRDFDRWVALGLELASYFDEAMGVLERYHYAVDRDDAPGAVATYSKRTGLVTLISGDLATAVVARIVEEASALPAIVAAAERLLARWSADALAGAVGEYAAGLAWYERPGLYREERDGLVITPEFVEGRVAMLLGRFPSSAPGNPEVFARGLVEEICAFGATASEIEVATRTVIRTLKFLPSVAELLSALRAAETPEGSEAFRVDGGEPMVLSLWRELAALVAWAKAHPAPMLPPARRQPQRLVTLAAPAREEEDGP